MIDEKTRRNHQVEPERNSKVRPETLEDWPVEQNSRRGSPTPETEGPRDGIVPKRVRAQKDVSNRMTLHMWRWNTTDLWHNKRPKTRRERGRVTQINVDSKYRGKNMALRGKDYNISHGNNEKYTKEKITSRLGRRHKLRKEGHGRTAKSDMARDRQ